MSQLILNLQAATIPSGLPWNYFYQFGICYWFGSPSVIGCNGERSDDTAKRKEKPAHSIPRRLPEILPLSHSTDRLNAKPTD